MKINLDLTNLSKIRDEGDKIKLEPEAEKVLIEILEAETLIAETKELVKDMLKDEALKLNPKFNSLRGESIVIAYRAGGKRYLIDEKADIKKIPPVYYSAKTYYNVNSDIVEQFLDEKGGLPEGIIDNPSRTEKRISFYIKKSKHK